jgi:hypothetical protein
VLWVFPHKNNYIPQHLTTGALIVIIAITARAVSLPLFDE